MSYAVVCAEGFQNDEIIYALTASSDGALVTINYVTEQTHAGRFFFTSYYNASVANNGTLDVLVQVNANALHMGLEVNTGGQGTLQIFEDATVSSVGTGLTVFNANRNSIKTTTATVSHTPTVTGTGTTLITSFTSGGRGGNAVGATSGEFARITEILTKLNSKYLLRFTNTSGNAVPVSLQVGYFEEV